MKRSLAIIICLAALTMLASLQEGRAGRGSGFGAVPVNSCLNESCHYDQIDKFRQNAEEFRKKDVHFRQGMTCIDCHQITTEHLEDGDPFTAMDRPPYPWEQPEFCGRCHSDALVMRRFDPAPDLTAESLFRTSKHGQAQERISGMVDDGMLDPQAAASIARNVATCTFCHGVHGIFRVDDALAPVFPRNVAATCGSCHHDKSDTIRRYSTGLARIDPNLALKEEKIELLTRSGSDYLEERNVHRHMLEDEGQLDAPTCNDCHGNHAATPPGALGATRVAEICGICHVQSYTDYMASTKAEYFYISEFRDCYACHKNHLIMRTSDEMLGLQEGSVCNDCHEEHGPEAEEVIAGMSGEIGRLNAARARAAKIVDEAERKGMDVSKGREKLAQITTALISAKAKVHRFDTASVSEAAEPGFALAEEARQIGEDALRDLTFRHWGLAASSLIILFTAALVALKIRQIDRRAKEKKG